MPPVFVLLAGVGVALFALSTSTMGVAPKMMGKPPSFFLVLQGAHHIGIEMKCMFLAVGYFRSWK